MPALWNLPLGNFLIFVVYASEHARARSGSRLSLTTANCVKAFKEDGLLSWKAVKLNFGFEARAFLSLQLDATSSIVTTPPEDSEH